MGFERLLSGPMLWYSKHLRFVQQEVSQHASMCRHAPQIKRNPTCMSGLCSRIVALKDGLKGVGQQQLTGQRGLCTPAQLPRDVTLFEHDRTRFFRLLSAFCGGQFLFWAYLGQFAYTGLRDTGGAKNKASSPPTTTGLAGMWSFEMNLGSSTWRYGFTLGCLAIGTVIVGLGALFCRRSVSQVILHKGGRMVSVSTQSPLGMDRAQKITVPLSEVACYAHRQESPMFIPLRVKGHKFYFLLDKEGTINNARLFDVTVGAYRVI